MTIGFDIHNRSQEVVLCAITNKTNLAGFPDYFEVQPGGNCVWVRYGWEDVAFKNKDDSKKKSLWINRGSPAVVYFDGFDHDLTILNDYKPEATFLVNNHTGQDVFCCISTTSGGDGNWFKIPPGQNETWRRTGWETVAFKNEADTERKGVYVNNQGTRATIDFHGFDKDIVVHDPPANFILDEHYAEAIVIAHNSQYAQSSRASVEGGLTASIYKVDTLELLSTGKKMNLDNHNQIYTLAMLINHLKYGAAEPAAVVAVDEEWVKVAAYTGEFDSIVVLGFPTKAVDLVAPGKQRPAIGTRMLVVSQFTYKDANKQGVQGDITTGPRTLNRWYNFHPLVAQFVSDDSQAPIWHQRMVTIDEDLWGRLWERWLEWKERHGTNYFRLGTPSRIQLIATHHAS